MNDQPWWRGVDPGHRLTGKRAFVTGAGTAPGGDLLGIGEAIAVLFASQGAKVAVAAIPHLKRAGGGSIINVSSVAATRALGAGAYAASKAAIQALTRDWALLHGRDHIRANCIVVGHAHTPMGTTDEAGRERRRLVSLLGTEGVAWDIAWPAVFLASEESRWISGVDLPVDAGATATTALGIHMLNRSGRTEGELGPSIPPSTSSTSPVT